MKKHTLYNGVATFAFLASFTLVALLGGGCGLLLGNYLTYPHWHGYLPHTFWPTVGLITGLLAILAGFHSFRATRRYYRQSDSSVGHDIAA
jgi:hypothetical protein